MALAGRFPCTRRTSYLCYKEKNISNGIIGINAVKTFTRGINNIVKLSYNKIEMHTCFVECT